jgi:flagellar biosynthetic protein FlhB
MRWDFERSIRMTKEEVKQEYKQTEGDPLLRARIRARQRQIASRRMMAEVPRADVVITNPVFLAVALRYSLGEMGAPRVVAKGQRRVAERIREIAAQSDVPLVENPWLARTLFESVDLGQEVPEALYKAVAEVLAYVYQVKRVLVPAARAP